MPAIIIAVLLWRIPSDDWTSIRDQPKNYGYLTGALLTALLAVIGTMLRWRLLVRALDIPLGWIEAFRLGSIGFLLSFVSAGTVGGDVFKAAFLARRRPGKRTASAASVVVDRACGMYALLVLVGFGLMTADSTSAPVTEGPINLRSVQTTTILLLVAGTTILAALVLGGRGIDALVRRTMDVPVLGSIVGRVGPPMRVFHDSPGAIAGALLLSLGIQSLLVFSFYLIAVGLYSDPPTLFEHFIITPVVMLVGALPITPAGVGVLEVATEAMYRLFDRVGSEPVASGTLVALVFELVKVIVAATGAVFYWTSGREVRDAM